ncbi:MAG TPA: ribose-phosphate diphosphokinase [Steroidobacteraceae bacterium]|nr:ribose-phosphate diphosphokinase [Steroidobacteraceae bacterium]
MGRRSEPTPCLFALSESRVLGSAVAAQAGIPLGQLEERNFEGGEFKLRPLESVRSRAVFVLQVLTGTADAPLAQRLLRLLFLLRGLGDAGAEHRVALVPYLAFARKDRRTQPRDPVSSRYVAELLESAGAQRVVAIDVHNAAAFDNAFRVPTDHLTALPLIVHHFATTLAGAPIAVASPDVGGIKRAQIFRELLARRLARDIDLVFIEKRRAGDVVSGGSIVGAVADKAVILIDDLCATGGTLVRAAAACRAAGALSVHAAVAHAPLAAGLEKMIASPDIASAVVTDAAGVPLGPRAAAPQPDAGKLTVLTVAPLLGLAVKRMLEGRPLAPLLDRWPLGPE